MSNNVKSRIQMKADTAANWKTAGDNGFTPLAREAIFYTDTGEIKLGDGKTNVNDLPQFNVGKRTPEGGIIFGEGEAHSPGSVAAGSTDIEGLSELGGSIKLSPANADGDASVALGANSTSLSPASMSFGVNVTAGHKAYYWDEINVNAKTITLSTTRRGVSGTPTYPSKIEGWSKGDTVTIINKDNYVMCAKIDNISGNTITLDNMPFTGNNYGFAEILLNYGGLPHARTIMNNDKPDKGVITLGFGAVAMGGGKDSNTMAQGMMSYAFGYQNIAGGSFGFVAGRENKVGYAAAGFGWGNEANAAYSAVFGNSNKITNSGYYTLVSGYQNEASGEFSLLSGRGLKSGTNYQAIFGKYNSPDTSALLLVGMGTGDDSSSRKNAFKVDTSGNAWVTGNVYTNNKILASQEYVDGKVSNLPYVPSSWLSKHTSADGVGNECIKLEANSFHFGHDSEVNNYWGAVFGTGTIANGNSQFVIGAYNILDWAASSEGYGKPQDTRKFGECAFIIGNGENADARNNAFAVEWNGDTLIAGDLYVNSAFERNQYINGLGEKSFLKPYANKVITYGEMSSLIKKDGNGTVVLVSDPSSYYAYSIKAGSGTEVSQQGAVAMGYSTKATNYWTAAFGSYSEANGNASFAAGNRAITSSSVKGQAVFGDTNVVDNNAQFIVGCNGKNGLVVKTNGDAHVYGNIYATDSEGNRIDLRNINRTANNAEQQAYAASLNASEVRGYVNDLTKKFNQLGNVMKFRGAVTNFNIENPQIGDVVVFLTDYYITNAEGEQELKAAAGSEWVYVQTKEEYYIYEDGDRTLVPAEYDWIAFGNCDATQALVSELDVQIDALDARVTSTEEEITELQEALSGNIGGEKYTDYYTPGLQFELAQDGKSYSVIGFTGESEELIIPKVYQGLPVTKICRNTIPVYHTGSWEWNEEYQESDWVENPEYARVIKIKNIVIPETVTLIEEGAFNGLCNYAHDYDSTNTCIRGQIEHITLPFIGIYKDAKEPDSYLGAIFGKTGTGSSQPDGDWPYWWDGDYYEQTGMDSCYAIHTPRSLKTVTVLDSVGSLMGYQFMGCPNLTSLYIHKPQDYKNINFVDINNSYNAPNAKVYYDLINTQTIENKVTEVDNKIIEAGDRISGVEDRVSTLEDTISSMGYEDPACAEYTFTQLANGTYAVKKYTGTGTETTIPTVYNGIPVTEISSSCFSDNSTLTKINIPANIVAIGSQAFVECTALQSIHLPATIKTVGTTTFVRCTALTKAIIDCDASAMTSAFNGCSSLKVLKLSGRTIKIPNSFCNGCTSLQEIEIPEGVEELGKMVFNGCTSLTKIKLPSTITTLALGKINSSTGKHIQGSFTNSSITGLYCEFTEGAVSTDGYRWGLSETAVIHYNCCKNEVELEEKIKYLENLFNSITIGGSY